MSRKTKKPKETHWLLCAPATADWMAQHSTFDKCCDLCNQRIMIAPTSQHLVKKGIRLICWSCFDTRELLKDDIEIRLPAPAEQMLDEVRRAVPNLYKKRN